MGQPRDESRHRRNDQPADVARERGLTIDEAGFEAAMEAQRDRARAASKFTADLTDAVKMDEKTTFSGYEHLADSGRVTALIVGGARVDALTQGQQGRVVLDHTPFYAESGGQVGDAGVLLGGSGARFEVRDTQKLGAAFAHAGVLAQGEIRVGDRLQAQVDQERRRAIARNHSATHLLHAALRETLGTHVQQKGSLVAADRLRFDFSHARAMSAEEIGRVERRVNEVIRANAAAETRVMSFEAAVAAGAMALFGEKYAEDVRVLRIGEFSMELCGGTHVARAGDIGLFKIVSETGVAAGVRRIEALTGEAAYDWVVDGERMLAELGALVRGGRGEVEQKVRDLLDRSRKLEKEVTQLKARLASGGSGDLAAAAKVVDGVKVLAARVDEADPQSLRSAVDRLKSSLGDAVVVLGAAHEGKVSFVVGVSPNVSARIKAGEIASMVATEVGGRGGGRADFAQAGGNQPENLSKALERVVPWVRSRLAE